MARIENHYNILALIFDSSNVDYETGDVMVPADLLEEYVTMMTEAKSTLICVSCMESQPENMPNTPAFLSFIERDDMQHLVLTFQTPNYEPFQIVEGGSRLITA